MKKITLCIIIALSVFNFISASQLKSFGYDVNEVPTDWVNDLWLNSDFKTMKPGDTYNIVARRMPEARKNDTDKDITLPTFHYKIVEGNSVSVSEEGLVTALTNGVSVIEVTYDELAVYGKTYAAISPVNVTYMVVDVESEQATGIEIEANIAARSYDTYYFTENEYPYTFTPSVTGAESVVVKCNDDIIAKNEDGSYTLPLKNRANIVEIAATSAEKTKRYFQVIDARKINVLVDGVNIKDAEIESAKEVKITFEGVTMPLYKVNTIYNPAYSWSFGSPEDQDDVRMYFQNEKLGTVKTSVNTQWNIETNNTIKVTFPEGGDYTFTKGYIKEFWWGEDLGAEKEVSGQLPPNLSAFMNVDNFCSFSDFTIKVKSGGSVNIADISAPRIKYESPYLALENCQDSQLVIYNTQGQPVKAVQISTASESIEISDLPSGIYIIRCASATLKITK